MKRLWLAGVLASALVLTGCGRSELYTGLTEREVNEMVAVMESAGLDASKTTKDSKTWTLEATPAQFPQAVALLQARGYPRERFESLGDVFKKQGFVSSPMEERARLMYGLSQELSNTLSNIDGVVSARVHLAVPEADPMSDTVKPSSASVFIKHDPQVDLSSQVGSIKALVVNSIEGLPYDRVTVVMVPARPLPPAVRQTSMADAGLPLAAILGLLGIGTGFEAWRRSRRARPATGRELVR